MWALQEAVPHAQASELMDVPFMLVQTSPRVQLLLDEVQKRPVLPVQGCVLQRHGAVLEMEESVWVQAGAAMQRQ